MYSQSNEDEVVAEIFARIGEGEKRFIEFGCGDGRQNNTIALVKRGWWGTWFDPHRRRIQSARERWAGYPVSIVRRRITPRNVNKNVAAEIDFLSIDIDGPDYAVWLACRALARVVCIEVVTPQQQLDLGYGTTLDAMWALARLKGYDFVAQSKSGVNAFFVRNGL